MGPALYPQVGLSPFAGDRRGFWAVSRRPCESFSTEKHESSAIWRARCWSNHGTRPGPSRSATIRASVPSSKRSAYCGLCSAEKRSADKVVRPPISTQRNKPIQQVLVEAARLAPRWVTSWPCCTQGQSVAIRNAKILRRVKLTPSKAKQAVGRSRPQVAIPYPALSLIRLRREKLLHFSTSGVHTGKSANRDSSRKILNTRKR